MKIRLPRIGRGKAGKGSVGAGGPGDAGASSSGVSPEESAARSSVGLELGMETSASSVAGEVPTVADPSGGVVGERARIAELAGQLRSVVVWSTFLSVVFVVFAWVNLPTRAIAWRVSQEAKANGFIVEIDDVSVTPWGTITLHDVAWHFATKRPEEVPVPFISEQMTLSVGVISYLLGELDVSLEGDVDTGSVEMDFERSSGGSSLVFDLIDVPLYALPKVQQAMNAPVRGELSLHVEIASPDDTFSKASGAVTVDCRECVVGDGETKLFVPGAKGMLANGMTVPEMDFGAVSGSIEITDGKGEAKEVMSKSEDITIQLYGDLQLADPIGKSELDLRLKVFISEKMRQDNADIGLMIATASKKVKLTGEDEGGLGYRLMGSFGRPKLRSFKYKTAKERRDERAAKSRERAAKSKKKKKSPRPKPKPKPKKPTRSAGADGPAEGRVPASAERVPSGTATPARTRDGGEKAGEEATPAAFLGPRELPERGTATPEVEAVEPMPSARAEPVEPSDEDGAEAEGDEEVGSDDGEAASEDGDSGGESGTQGADESDDEE